MKSLFVTLDISGVVGFSDNESPEVIVPITKDFDEAVDQVMRLDKEEAVPFIKEFYEQVKDKYDVIYVDSEKASRILYKAGIRNVEVAASKDAFKKLKSKLPQVLVEKGVFSSIEEFWDYRHKFSTELVRRQLRAFAKRRDLLAAQGIRAIDDLDKTYNLFAIRTREWYSVHFPELDQLIPDHDLYLRLVEKLGIRDNFTVENLLQFGLSKEKAQIIEEKARSSIGADLSDFDIKPIQTLAKMANDMYELRQELVRYIDAVMREVAPNITALVGSLLGARLISLAGSLEDLAKLPASTIQVLGAEKALFRALRFGGKPPKHGVIFQYPDINKSPRWQRGKIARALAGKLAIAAKVDAYTGRFIGDKLVEDLRKRIEEIKKLYAKPPPRKEAPPSKPKPRKEGKEKRREKRR
ncbi:MAG: C/D box methylation guide ribonucleoprotein complex aNOP56 subunit [Desulfurococcales archaeon]|jgi:nucleolar protein 56|nr:C/D box methylation guide ribonucleoprotein complex aNOP56 subunit [Desulfurococcales archaeon]